MNYRARLAKLEKVTNESFRTMSDEDLVTEIDDVMKFSRYTVCYHLNHPDGVFAASTGEHSEDDITLQMIADSDAVDDVARKIATVLISAGCRKLAAEQLQKKAQENEE